MPRCIDDWRRGGAVTVAVKATCEDQGQFYALTFVFFPRPELPHRLGDSFNSAELAQGVEWEVPEGYRCGFQILTTGTKAIDTRIELNGVVVPCHPGAHCQGACTPAGTAGVAGDWTVSAVRMGP